MVWTNASLKAGCVASILTSSLWWNLEIGLKRCLSDSESDQNNQIAVTFCSLGDEVWKTLTVGHSFQKNSRFQEKTMANQAKHLLWYLLWGSTIAIITPMRQACTCGRVRDPGLTPRAPKQWKSDISIYRVKTLSAWERNPRKKNREREIQYKERVSVHWHAQFHAKWPTWRGCK